MCDLGRYSIVEIHGPDESETVTMRWGYGIYDSRKKTMRDFPVMRTRVEAERKLARLDPYRELSFDHV